MATKTLLAVSTSTIDDDTSLLPWTCLPLPVCLDTAWLCLSSPPIVIRRRLVRVRSCGVARGELGMCPRHRTHRDGDEPGAITARRTGMDFPVPLLVQRANNPLRSSSDVSTPWEFRESGTVGWEMRDVDHAPQWRHAMCSVPVCITFR
ncbi:hypothetical protein BS78_01G456300 [Paspalum vaginatum]|nr:hypothetical protein BS78_01G456300 [Paspalum vaginatum]